MRNAALKKRTLKRHAGYRFSAPPSMERVDFPFQIELFTSIIKGLAASRFAAYAGLERVPFARAVPF
jgi:hypothetical protein